MTKQVLSATAVALLLSVSALGIQAASAQNGGEARSADRQVKKSLDDKHLTPVRPIRRVGEDGWPDAKNQPAVRETTGQSAKEDSKDEKKENTAQNTPQKPEAKPEAKSDTKNSPLGNQAPPPDNPRQDAQKNDAHKKSERNTAAQAKPDTDDQKNARAATPDNERKTAGRKDDRNTGDNNDKNFASIRLGTDEQGRVAVNDAQQRQIATVMHKHHVETVNVKVSIGSVAPANVHLVATSSDFIEVFPQFRGYSYFATADDVVIVEPSTKKVVALLPVKSTAVAARPVEEHAVPAQAESRSPARAKTLVRERDVTVGQGIPSEAEILAAPVARAPAGTTITRTYRNYRYEPYDDDDVVVIERRRRPRFFPFW